MVRRLLDSKLMDARDIIRSLPRQFAVGDYFTGAATFSKVTSAITDAFRKLCPDAAKDFKAGLVLGLEF